MAPYDRGIWNINRHRGRIADNETVAAPTYPSRDVIACGGRVPHYDTAYDEYRNDEDDE